MKHKAIGLPYIHSPSNLVVGSNGEILEVKKYQNGGKYVTDKKKPVSFGKLPTLSDLDVSEFAKIFC